MCAKHRFLLLLLAGVLSGALGGCQAGHEAGPGSIADPEPLTKAGLPPVECASANCIADFLNDTPCDGGASRADLVIGHSGGQYDLGGHYILDGCSGPAGSEENWIGILGADPAARPTVTFPGAFGYGATGLHATLHVVENLNPQKPNLFRDVDFVLEARMRSGTAPAIQFEMNSIELRDCGFAGPGTTHFLAVKKLVIAGVDIAPEHEFVIGDPQWCGERPPATCAGPPPLPPTTGASVSGSALAGRFAIDCVFLQDNTIRFSGNDPVSALDLRALAEAGAEPRAELDGNVFATGAGPKVLIAGDYRVVARGNVTHQGPSLPEAMKDFDVSAAAPDNPEPLRLETWVHAGVTYSSALVISDIATSFDPLACTRTITWTTNLPADSRVFFGGDCGRLDLTAGSAGPTTNHSVTFSVSDLPSRYAFRVESASPEGERRISKCITETRGRCVRIR